MPLKAFSMFNRNILKTFSDNIAFLSLSFIYSFFSFLPEVCFIFANSPPLNALAIIRTIPIKNR